MNCKNCGNYIVSSTEPCPYCGEINVVEQGNTEGQAILPIVEEEQVEEKVDEQYQVTNQEYINLIPNPDFQPVVENLQEEQPLYEQNLDNIKETNNKLSKKQMKLIIVTILFIFVSIFLIILVLNPNLLNINKNKKTINSENTVSKKEVKEYMEEEGMETSEEYYQKNSKVIKTIDGKKEKNVFTEKEVIKFLKDRGFKDMAVFYNYDMDGEYNDDTVIENPTNNKHPMYQSYYQSKNTGLWTIYVVRKEIEAYPIEKILELSEERKITSPIIVSEKKTIISYDNIENKYYITIPKKEMVDLRTVKKINTKNLDNFKFE